MVISSGRLKAEGNLTDVKKNLVSSIPSNRELRLFPRLNYAEQSLGDRRLRVIINEDLKSRLGFNSHHFQSVKDAERKMRVRAFPSVQLARSRFFQHFEFLFRH